MAICFNESTVPAEPFAAGRRQRLITPERIPGSSIRLDRLSIDAGATLALPVDASALAWIEMLDGSVELMSGETRETLLASHVALLPAGEVVSITARAAATLLFAAVPDAARFDPAFSLAPPAYRSVDWTREPVLDSQHDARKRIYLVTPKMFSTKVIKGEMIIYPPGTMAANHHHEGAEHFMYILKGGGTAWANEVPFEVTAGDVVYYHDRERHYLKADDRTEMVFAEFFVPAEFKTIWVNDAEVCTWLPTGRSMSGAKPVREIAAHSSAETVSPADV